MRSKISLILKLLEQSVDLVYQNDKYLIEHSIHEQDLSHRIAFYFENLLRNYDWFTQYGYSVDVEYNKNFDDSKRVYDKCINCELENCYIKKSNYNNRKYSEICRPDIILHKRGENNNSCEATPNSKEDFAKLSAFTCKNSDYKYHKGVFINFKSDEADFEYFDNGKKEE